MKSHSEELTVLDLSHLFGDLADDLQRQVESHSVVCPGLIWGHAASQPGRQPITEQQHTPGDATSLLWEAHCTQMPEKAGAPENRQTVSRSVSQIERQTASQGTSLEPKEWSLL